MVPTPFNCRHPGSIILFTVPLFFEAVPSQDTTQVQTKGSVETHPTRGSAAIFLPVAFTCCKYKSEESPMCGGLIASIVLGQLSKIYHFACTIVAQHLYLHQQLLALSDFCSCWHVTHVKPLLLLLRLLLFLLAFVLTHSVISFSFTP